MSTLALLQCSTGAEGWRLRGGAIQTPPGPEGSNGKVRFPGVVARWASSPFGNCCGCAPWRWDRLGLFHRPCFVGGIVDL